MGEKISQNQLESKIIDVIIDAVHLQHINKSDITSSTPLTQGGLDLDSIDILEIVVAIEHKFGVKVKDAEKAKKYFSSIGSIAEFIESQASSATQPL